MTAQVPDFEHIGFRQFCRRTVFASAARTVDECIGHVLNARCPSQMRFRDAAKLTLAAVVCRIVLRRWRRAVHFLTSEASDIELLNLRVAGASSRERPDEAGVVSTTLIGQNEIAEESLRFAHAPRLASERVTISAPAVGVRAAIAVRVMRLAATFNRAFSESHFDGPFVGVVRARRSAGTLGGFVIGTGWPLEISCMRGAR